MSNFPELSITPADVYQDLLQKNPGKSLSDFIPTDMEPIRLADETDDGECSLMPDGNISGPGRFQFVAPRLILRNRKKEQA